MSGCVLLGPQLLPVRIEWFLKETKNVQQPGERSFTPGHPPRGTTRENGQGKLQVTPKDTGFGIVVTIEGRYRAVPLQDERCCPQRESEEVECRIAPTCTTPVDQCLVVQGFQPDHDVSRLHVQMEYPLRLWRRDNLGQPIKPAIEPAHFQLSEPAIAGPCLG